jgi:exonuclease III
MHLRIISWNVRGLNCRLKRSQIKNALKLWKGEVICLQETKLENISRSVVRSLWSNRFADWKFLESEGASGGILLMWDNRVTEVQDCVKGQFSISCRFKNVQDQFEWAFSGVYGPNLDVDRFILWDELAGVRSWWGVPWCIGGDFNVVRFPSEKLRAGRLTRAMTTFSDFIAELGLIDLPLLEGQFTWSNNQDPPSKSRIDRFLLSSDWEDHFSHVVQKALRRFVSDHCPISLDSGTYIRGKSYFKFENMWLRHEAFTRKVRDWWGSYDFQGSPSFVLASKLKVLKEDIKKWNRESFGDVHIKKLELMRDLQDLEAKENQGLFTGEDRVHRLNTQSELEKTLLLDEVSWRQKSRVQWLKEGDKNTKFFHRTANANRRNNCIESMTNGELKWETQDEIREGIVAFYKDLYSEREHWRPVLEGLEFSSLEAEEATHLERPFSEEEVVLALNQISGEKAPGPDGFTLAFFHHCWDVVKKEVLDSI